MASKTQLDTLFQELRGGEAEKSEISLLKCYELCQQLARTKTRISKHECEYVASIFKQAMGKRRNNLRTIRSKIDFNAKLNKNKDLETPADVYKYMDIPYLELEALVNLTDDTLKPLITSGCVDEETEIIILKTSCDATRYLCEFAKAEEKERFKQVTLQGYESIVMRCEPLTSTSDIKVGVTLNFAVFLYEHMGDRDRAIQVADDAIARIAASNTGIGEKKFYWKLLEDNVYAWKHDGRQ